MSKPSIKIAHISDLHFSKILWDIKQFFSKRWIGNLNVIFNRRKIHLNYKPYEIIPFLKNKNYTHVLISGDVSTTSHKKEFDMAKAYIKQLEELGLKVYLIPGNHDCYLKRVERKKLFYKHFKDYFPGNISSIKQSKIEKVSLDEGLWLVLLDTTKPCPIHLSQGFYTLEHDKLLQKTLASIPKKDSIILMNHFPLFQYESKRRSMLGAELLQKTLKKFPNVVLYLHGHTHKNTVANLRSSGFPIILDSGSLSHNTRSFFNSITIADKQVIIQSLKYKSKNLWIPFKTIETNL